MSVEFQDNTAAVLAQFERSKAKALVMIGIKAQENATIEVNKQIYSTKPPKNYKRTLRLRGSIAYQAEPENDQVVIGTPVEYAIYVHEGTYKMTGRPFIKEAVLNYQGDYRKIIEQALGEGFGQ